MKYMKHIFLSVLLLFVIFFAGCGYKIGYIGHPQLKSVAIAPVVNETLSFNASAQLRGLLAESFQTDGTMKLVGMTTADCIVYARILSVEISEITWSSRAEDDFIPNQWRVKMDVEFSVVLPGKAEPLLKAQNATGSAEFMTGPDLEISRSYAIKQAALVAAKNIVSQVTEAW